MKPTATRCANWPRDSQPFHSGVVALAGVETARVSLLVSASDDLVETGVHSGNSSSSPRRWSAARAGSSRAGTGRRKNADGARGRRASDSRRRARMNPRAVLAVPALLALLGAAEEPADSQIRSVALRRRGRDARPAEDRRILLHGFAGRVRATSNNAIASTAAGSTYATKRSSSTALRCAVKSCGSCGTKIATPSAVSRRVAASDQMLFLGTDEDGHHLDYVYEVSPLDKSAATAIDRVTIDGRAFCRAPCTFARSGLGDRHGRGRLRAVRQVLDAGTRRSECAP